MALGLLPLATAFVGSPGAGLQGALASRRNDARVGVRGGVRAAAAVGVSELEVGALWVMLLDGQCPQEV